MGAGGDKDTLRPVLPPAPRQTPGESTKQSLSLLIARQARSVHRAPQKSDWSARCAAPKPSCAPCATTRRGSTRPASPRPAARTDQLAEGRTRSRLVAQVRSPTRGTALREWTTPFTWRVARPSRPLGKTAPATALEPAARGADVISGGFSHAQRVRSSRPGSVWATAPAGCGGPHVFRPLDWVLGEQPLQLQDVLTMVLQRHYAGSGSAPIFIGGGRAR